MNGKKVWDEKISIINYCDAVNAIFHSQLEKCTNQNRKEVLVSNSVEDYHLLHGKR